MLRRNTFLKACSMIMVRSVFGILGNRSRMASSACLFISSCNSGIGSTNPGVAVGFNTTVSPRISRASSTIVSRK